MQPKKIICKNCRHHFIGTYCNECGEKVYTEHDKSVFHLLEEGFHFATHFEGKFLTTIRTILTRPGKVSLDYCNGIRKKYFKPLSFFLLLVVIYLLFPLAQGLNMTLNNHVHAGLYGKYAMQQVTELMTTKKFSETYVVEHFHTTSEKVSKILLVFIIPVMALWASLLTFKKRKPFFDHFIFATEINSFLLLGGFLILPFLMSFVFKLISLLTKQDYFSDAWVGLVVGFTIFIYTFIAAKCFYFLKTMQAILFALFFIGVYIIVIQWLYKFLLFFITLKLIH